MLNMLNDPEIDKLIIYALVGVSAVLMLAVIFLAVKRNVYYVDDSGVEVPPPPKKKLFSFGKKKKEEPEAPAEVPAAEPEVMMPATAADVPVSEDSFGDEFSLPVFPGEPAEAPAPEALPEEAPAETPAETPVEVPAEETPAEPAMNDEDVDAAVGEILDDIPVSDTEEPEEAVTRVIERPEDMPKDEDVFAEAPAAEPVITDGPIPTGLEVAVVIGNNVREYSLNQLPCLLGRDAASCDLVIAEPAVSRKHARILAIGSQLYIEDVSEHNGTFLNMTKLPSLGRAVLNAGDRITLGRATIDVTKVLYGEE